MMKYGTPRMVVTLCLGVALGWSALGVGCNPKVLGSMNASRHVPATPGSNPYIVLRFTNTVVGPDQSPVEVNNPPGANFSVTWRYAGGGKDSWGFYGDALHAGEDVGTLLPCNITVLTAGDVDDMTVSGGWLSYNPPGVDPVRQMLPPMGKNLTNGLDFRCGDVITFMLTPNNDVAARYSITCRVDSGQDEAGPYTGPDTFANMYGMTEKWEDETGITIPVPYIP